MARHHRYRSRDAPGSTQVSEVNIMAPRSIEDIKARADEFADAFENYEPKPGDQDAPIPPVMAVKLAAWRRDSAERELADAKRALALGGGGDLLFCAESTASNWAYTSPNSFKTSYIHLFWRYKYKFKHLKFI